MRIVFYILAAAGILGLSTQTADARNWTRWLETVFPQPAPDFERPYLERGKMLLPGIHEKEPALMRHWAESRGGADKIIRGFYATGVLLDQDLNVRPGSFTRGNIIPEFTVGLNFMRLANIDKRRVADFLDYAYNITGNESGPGTFVLKHWRSGEPVGIYSRLGLQLQ